MIKRLTLFLISLPFLCYPQVTLKQVLVIENKTSQDTVIGIDVSRYQGKINWQNLDTTVEFVIIKVSEGISRIDSRFSTNWEGCTVLKGGYHFFRPQFSGIQQANLFLKTLPIDSGNIIPCIDVEYTPYWQVKKNRKKAVVNLKNMVDKLRNILGTDPIIYTSKIFWEHYVFPYYKQDVKNLWVVDYRNTTPKTPNDKTWILWQYTNKGKFYGINTLVDVNICPNKFLMILKKYE